MRFNKLDLNQLVVLDALLSTLSVSKSAERLFLSQPATSCALARLREYFEDDLLVSVGKTNALTPLGSSLIKPVRDVLLQVQTITRARPSFDPSTSTRKFTIESSDYVINIFLSEVIRRASVLAPMMEFDLRSISPQTPNNLENGDAEILIIPHYATVQGHPKEELFEDKFSCLVCANGVFKDKEELTTDEYFDANHISVEWGGGRRITFDTRVISASNKHRKQTIVAPSFSLVPELLVGTNMIATLPHRLATKIAKQFPLKLLPCPADIPHFTENVQWHKFRDNDPSVLWLRQLFQETAATIIGGDIKPEKIPAKRHANTKRTQAVIAKKAK
ncbi:LysR family transcriptional regulator [Herbaspirillum lusitanum]|uniref:LysR family transcriptional regulator n=1 Tax=Herbaspirillum lusitanum TaxID=213312 RepID=UPI002236F35C|nr:LysR family transcriptional regulator [Herbaspirillum lusitanum]MCW5297710.1 LysR family transcriptional regulator [Herbaspirillum lusitanum]